MNSLAYGSRNSRRIESALRQQLLGIAITLSILAIKQD